MKQIIVHVGAPKCGSTYLQRVLLREQRTLRQHGLDYPHSGQGHPGNGLSIFELTEPWLAEKFERFQTVVFSHELLFARADDAAKLGTLCQKLNVQLCIVAFLRPFDDLIFGDFSQHIKQGLQASSKPSHALAGRSFRQFVWARHKDIQPAHFLDRWAAVTHESRMLVAAHTKIAETLALLNPAFAEINWHLPKWKANPSLETNMCEAMLANGAPCPDMHAQFPDPGRSQRRRQWINAVFAQQRRDLIDRFEFDPMLAGKRHP